MRTVYADLAFVLQLGLVNTNPMRQIRVKVAVITASLSLLASSLVIPSYAAATADCGSGAPNLVQNPGFESVSSTNSIPSKWYIPSNEVPYWSRPIGDSTNYPWVQTGVPTGVVGSWEGTKSAVISGVNGVIGISGGLSSPTTTGATYEVSAFIYVVDTGDPHNFELRLRNSTSGVESPVIATKTIAEVIPSFSKITGTITPNASYNQVTVRVAALAPVMESSMMFTSPANYLHRYHGG